MIKKQITYILLFALTAGLPSHLFASATGVVSAKTLNVRVRPTTQFSITGVLKKGDRVTILKREANWYMIAAPKNSAVWVSRLFIKGDIITKRVNLRCGPSVAFKKYTAVNAGLKVTVLNNAHEDWVQIAPPRGLAAYVSTQFVTIVNQPQVAKKPQVKQTVKKPVAVVKKQPVKQISTVNPKTAATTNTPATKAKIADKFANMTLEELLNYHKEKPASSATNKAKDKFVKQIKKTVSFQGYLLPLAEASPVATHCIAIKVHDEYIKTCFIYTDNYNLTLWENRKVSVKGVQHWVKDWVIPVVEAESIRPVWNN